MSLPTVGAQLIVFGPKYNATDNADFILSSLAESGYAAVEGGGKDPVAYKAKLDEYGLVYGGSHTGMNGLLDLKPIIAYLKAVGACDVCNSGFIDWKHDTLDAYLKGIKILNEAGRQLRDEGIRLHYHNHAFEFDKIDGDRTGMDVLIDGLDFDVVDLCVDVAWVYRGGDDPASYLTKHKDIIGYLHFKDTDGENWKELGRGKVDFHSIMKVLPTLDKVRWVMIEQDKSDIDPRESMRISRAYLRDTFGY